MLAHRPHLLSRTAAVVLAPVLALSLAACGSDDSEGAQGFDAVTVSGDVGTTPTFDFSDKLASGKAEQKTLVTGDGAEIADGDQVMVQLTVANGFTQDIDIDTYDDTLPGFVATVGADASDPQVAGDLFADYVAARIEPGMTVGTRIAITVGVDKAFPDYATALTDYDIGSVDGLHCC